jgi:hypothetical protein
MWNRAVANAGTTGLLSVLALSLPIFWLRWLVLVVVLYAAFPMLRSRLKERP